MANEIQVSRTPVRDALRKLETDGLVTINSHLGASVKKMDLKEFREMCDLRLALESHAAGLAAINHTEADLGEIQYALEDDAPISGTNHRGRSRTAAVGRTSERGRAFPYRSRLRRKVS